MKRNLLPHGENPRLGRAYRLIPLLALALLLLSYAIVGSDLPAAGQGVALADAPQYATPEATDTDSGAVTSGSGYRFLDVTGFTQPDKVPWCWAAACKMIIQYEMGSSPEQCELANYLFGRDDCCPPREGDDAWDKTCKKGAKDVREMAKVLVHWHVASAYAESYNFYEVGEECFREFVGPLPTFNEVKLDIDSGHPVGAVMCQVVDDVDDDPCSCHAVLISGYYIDRGSICSIGQHSLRIINPWYGSPEFVDYESFCQGMWYTQEGDLFDLLWAQWLYNTRNDACSHTANEVALYTDSYQRGQCKVLGVGDYANPAEMGLPNDSLTSFRVGDDVALLLCRDDGLSGGCELLIEDDEDLSDNAIGNDQVSSLRVFARGSPAPPPDPPDPPPLPPPSENVEVVSVYPLGHNFAPGEQFQPRVRIRVSGFTLSETNGDHLHNLDDQVYGSWPVQAVRGENLTEYEFVIDPMTAPSSVGTYTSKWQLRVSGDHIGPQITLSFNVQNAPPPDPEVNAWRIEYYRDDHLGSKCAEVWEDTPYIFKDWEYGAPVSGCESNHWSARFTRQVYFAGGNYSFHVQHDDGIRLYVDGQLVRGLDCWWPGDGGHNSEGNVYLSKGNHEVKLEYFDQNDHARVELYWYGPGALPSNVCDPAQWCAQYRGNERLWGPIVFLRNEGAYFLSKDWGSDGPGYGLPSDQFCSRFERTLYFPSGRWRFHIFSDDGFRFWVDGDLVLDEWHDQRESHTVDVDLEAGEHSLRAEHFEKSGWAAFSLSWENITPPDTTAPTLVWILPVADGETYHVTKDHTIELCVNASDDVEVDRVEFTRWDAVNERNVSIGWTSNSPYRVYLDSEVLNEAWNQINAYAYDTSRNVSVRKIIWIYRAQPDTTPPEVVWISPTDDYSIVEVEDETVRFEVSCVDDRGVASVSFELYDTIDECWTTLGSLQAPPYVLVAQRSALGPVGSSQLLRARAVDEAGNDAYAIIEVYPVEPLPEYEGCGPASGVWPLLGCDLRHSGTSPFAGPATPEVLWSFYNGSPSQDSSAVIGPDGIVYIGGSPGSVYALTPAGNVIWQFSDGDDYFGLTPALAANGTLYTGSRAGTLYALDTHGNEKWRYEMGGWSTSPIIGPNGFIYVGSGSSNRLFALDPHGELRWSFGASSWINPSPALAYDGTLYVASSNTKVYAITQHGTPLWSYGTGGYVDASPTLAMDGTIYVGSWDGKLHAINPDGTEKWTYATEGAVGSPALARDGTIYAGSKDGNLYAIQADGSLRWQYETGDEADQQPAIGADGTIYASSDDGYLRAFDADGSLKWQLYLGRWLGPPAIGTGGRIYVSDQDTLYCVGEQGPPPASYLPLVLR